jgi:hypothetical protein
LPFLISHFKTFFMTPARIALLAVVFITLGGVFAQGFLALEQRSTVERDAEDRIYGAAFLPYFTVTNAQIVGEGVGSTFMALAEVTQGQTSRDMNFDELNQDRLAKEVGLLGYVFLLALKLIYIAAAFLTYLRASNLVHKVAAMIAGATLLSAHWQIPIYNAVASSFFFASIGLLFWIRLTARAAREATHTIPNPLRGSNSPAIYR